MVTMSYIHDLLTTISSHKTMFQVSMKYQAYIYYIRTCTKGICIHTIQTWKHSEMMCPRYW